MTSTRRMWRGILRLTLAVCLVVAFVCMMIAVACEIVIRKNRTGRKGGWKEL